MEEITHYRFVKEKFLKEIITEVKEDKGAFFFDEDISALSEVKTHVVTKLVEIGSEAFKTAMSNDEFVTVVRETIVVSEDPQKNTISIKKYDFTKTLVPVKTLKRKRFKVVRKSSTSLTINKKTGDFSVYNKNKINKKKNSVFVRKNFSNNRVRDILKSFEKNTENLEEVQIAIKTFFTQLGYPNLKTTYTHLIKTFFNVDPNDVYGRTAIEMFPYLNYLYVNNINIKSYYLLYYFECIFNRNKSKYKNKSILDYACDYYGVKDRNFMHHVLNYLENENKNIVISNTLKNRSVWVHDYQNILKGINYTKLRLGFDLGFFQHNNQTLIDSYLNNFIISDTIYTQAIELNNYQRLLKYAKMYDFGYYNIINNNEERYFILLSLFEAFGIKLKIKNLQHFNSKMPIFKNILSCLFDSLNKGGSYTVDKKTQNRFKMYFRDGEKISFLTNIKYPKKNNETYNFFGAYENMDNTPGYTLDSGRFAFNVIKNKKVLTTIWVNPFTNAALADDNSLYTNFTRAFMNNTNSLATSTKIKFHYSKKYFEKLCNEKNIKIELYIDYLTENN
jgi:hypothetical protein